MSDIAAGCEAEAGSPDAYARAYESFVWDLPERYNIGVDVTDKWAAIEPDRVAIIDATFPEPRRFTFGELADQSNRLANLLVSLGIERGDRVAILAPQRVETAVAHAAVYKAGAIAVPLFPLFGEDALQYRLSDSGARLLLTDEAGRAKVAPLLDRLPELQNIVCFDDAPDYANRLAAMDEAFEAVPTTPDDPALIIYTSGTTGSPKGALHAHRVLPGHLSGVEMSHDSFPREGDCIWTPADWAWIGGLLDVLLPALHHGVPVVARRFDKFDAAAAFQLMQDCMIRNVFLPPTALKMLRQEPRPRERWNLSLRSVASGGESLGGELLDWGRQDLGVTINEFYGQTECNVVLSSCSQWFAPKPGAIGKRVPGHKVAIVDAAGQELAPGEEGNIAVARPDPVMFLEYWRNPAATRGKFAGDWLLTGDRGFADEQGYVHFVGREDDVITSSGYRIGPGEIEDCLLKHAAVAMAGVIGIPDPMRTELVGAFIVLKPGFSPGAELADELRQLVRTRLGGHQYPRAVYFIEELPLTVTGKVIRRELRDMAMRSETIRF